MLTIKHDGSIYAKNLQSEGSRLYSGKWSAAYRKEQERLGFIKRSTHWVRDNSNIIEEVQIGNYLFTVRESVRFYTISAYELKDIKERFYYRSFRKISRGRTEQQTYELVIKKFGELLSEYNV